MVLQQTLYQRRGATLSRQHTSTILKSLREGSSQPPGGAADCDAESAIAGLATAVPDAPALLMGTQPGTGAPLRDLMVLALARTYLRSLFNY